jgi:hypothetical protein
LLPGQLTPFLQEQLVRLGIWIPSFKRASELLEAMTGARVSEASVRRRTEEAGAAYVALQEREVEEQKEGAREESEGPAKMVVSVDGAMVPLVAGEWAEVKTMVLGEVEPPKIQGEDTVIKTRKLSYFSRLADAERFRWQALAETSVRGLATAGEVGSVSDGAEWIRGFVDFHRPDAVRILDFPHVAEHVNQIGQAVFGEGTPEARIWLNQQMQQLKAEGPVGLLATLRELKEEHSRSTPLASHLSYLEKREEQMQYPAYQVAGWPIGSGMVESANKLLVEERLKGSGMHWAREHVNPLVALRTVVFNDRWDDAWRQIAQGLCQKTWQRRLQRQQARRTRGAPPRLSEETRTMSCSPSAPQVPPVAHRPTDARPTGPHRPPPDHPWRHSPIGKARYQPWRPYEPTKS